MPTNQGLERGTPRLRRAAPGRRTRRDRKDTPLDDLVVAILRSREPVHAEIAKELFVSDATVKTHVRSMLHKLGLRDRTQLVIAAYESGFVWAAPR